MNSILPSTILAVNVFSLILKTPLAIVSILHEHIPNLEAKTSFNCLFEYFIKYILII